VYGTWARRRILGIDRGYHCAAMANKHKRTENTIAQNKKARFDFFIEDGKSRACARARHN
jgi:hypothetical protein